ncbi:hypothetical protein CSC94_09275 [Zhengella mangrovi]|uniref:UPF0276 protein CSC94_09275 n=1 Tax=Zhengella mangrovi TaxID=1982044 RepID=A0A2G1QNX1_9HYPH|nr:DUF692 domain-containing protein [Zhengella mangrovi]PHP67226.1 hypothetical protein CSC94_09275 [Zhengella mangrovi]
MPRSPQDMAARPSFPDHPVAGLAGASFKPQHLPAILADAPAGLFFEVHAENYMGAGGMPHAALAAIRERYPVSLHGVAMSIGGDGPLDGDHLARFAALVDHYQPALVSEHLAWSTHGGTFFNDLLPLPYTNGTLERVCEHVDRMQQAIARPILLENPATYVLFAESDWEETAFLAEVVRRTGCGLLLDINNVFVSATNHGFAPMTYLGRFPLEHVGEIHLAGHDRQVDDDGTPLLIDTHDRPVDDAVWDLYRTIIGQTGPLPTLVEWDAEVPEWPVLKAEAGQAQAMLDDAAMTFLMGKRHASA